jgi:hypothetical protein
MALPTLSKSWTILSNVAVPLSLNAQDANRRYIWTWKEKLVVLGWSLVGSGNATTSGMDAVDRWVSYADIVFDNYSGPKSWVVLQKSSIGTTFQVLIWMYGYVHEARFCSMWVSSVGFGTAHGGTDGSTTTRPTATDETQIFDATDVFIGNSAYSDACRLYMWQSSDGQMLYWARLLRSMCVSFGFMGKPKNPPAEWTGTTYIAGCYGAIAGGGARKINWYNAAITFTRIGSTNFSMFFTGEAFNNLLIGASQTFVGELSPGYPMCPIGLYSTTSPYRGRAGDMFDIFWGAENNVLVGDTYPLDGSRQFIQLDHLILPWDGSVPIIAN